MKRQIIPKRFKALVVFLKLPLVLERLVIFSRFFSKIWLKTPQRKSVAMEK